MNAKKAKRLRTFVKNIEAEPLNYVERNKRSKLVNIGFNADGTFKQQVVSTHTSVLDPRCARAIYQEGKKHV